MLAHLVLLFAVFNLCLSATTSGTCLLDQASADDSNSLYLNANGNIIYQTFIVSQPGTVCSVQLGLSISTLTTVGQFYVQLLAVYNTSGYPQLFDGRVSGVGTLDLSSVTTTRQIFEIVFPDGPTITTNNYMLSMKIWTSSKDFEVLVATGKYFLQIYREMPSGDIFTGFSEEVYFKTFTTLGGGSSGNGTATSGGTGNGTAAATGPGSTTAETTYKTIEGTTSGSQSGYTYGISGDSTGSTTSQTTSYTSASTGESYTVASVNGDSTGQTVTGDTYTVGSTVGDSTGQTVGTDGQTVEGTVSGTIGDGAAVSVGATASGSGTGASTGGGSSGVNVNVEVVLQMSGDPVAFQNNVANFKVGMGQVLNIDPDLLSVIINGTTSKRAEMANFNVIVSYTAKTSTSNPNLTNTTYIQQTIQSASNDPSSPISASLAKSGAQVQSVSATTKPASGTSASSTTAHSDASQLVTSLFMLAAVVLLACC